MRYETLSPVKKSKDENGNPEPNVISVTNNAYYKDSEDPALKGKALEIKFAAERMSFPQFDSLAEFVEQCGSEARALDVVNDVTQKYATTSGKAFVRNATTGSEDEIVLGGCQTSRDFSWKIVEQLSTKDKANAFEQIAALAQSGNLTPEEIMARILALSPQK